METENRQETIPAWFQQHPLLESFKKEKQAETLQRRQEAGEKLESILADIRSGFPEEEASLASVLQDLKAAERHLTDLKLEAEETGRKLRIAKNDLERKRAAVETELFSTYDPRIDEAQAFFRNKLDDLRQPGVIDSRRLGASRDLIRQNKEVRLENNFEAVEAAMAFCRGAIAKLESMKLIPEYPAAAVEKLKEEIPSIHVYQEYTAERPMPKGAPIDAGAPTDYEIQKLLARRV